MVVTQGTPDGPGVVRVSAADEAALARLAKHEPEKSAEELAAAVTVHLVTVKAAGDEEWRSAFGSGWQDAIANRIEAADDALNSVFGINLSVGLFVAWDSADIGGSVCQFLGEIDNEVPNGGSDVSIAYMGNSSLTYAGCAYLNGSYAVVKRQNATNDWKVTQHEVSHLYNAPDRSGSGHPNDVMEDPYGYANAWCTKAGYNDKGIITNNSGKFD